MARRRAHRLRVSREDFDELVRQAIKRLPACYRRLMDNIVVIVEEEPSREVLDELGLSCEDDLLGLYTGTAQGEVSFFDPAGSLPARVVLYRGPILRRCRTKAEVAQEVYDTVAHELGHHFGLEDEAMPF